LIFEKQDLDGVYIITPQLLKDDRGYFFESFRESEFHNRLNKNFVQDNEVFSKESNIIRGLHYQLDRSQGKLIHVVSGAIKDIAVDVRVGSPNFGRSFTATLTGENHKMLYVPEGFAHGYLVLEQNTIVHYKCTSYYHAESEYGVRWDDPDINIDWGISDPVLSKKDKMLPFLKMQTKLPRF
tara:strand:+ start:323 stop:868 length:546 start_codon:yes stop_codon:yes gene_type:complete